MTLNQMRYIVTLAKCLNYSEAAKKLYITQPALSRQIAAVEEELDIRLFNRSNKSTSLTDAGKLLASGLEEIIDKYDGLIDDVQKAALTGSQLLRIGNVEMRSMLNIVTQAVKKLAEHGVKVDLLSRNTVELHDMLINGDLDVIITYGNPLANSPEYKCMILCTVENCLVVPKSHPMADKENPSIGDFKDSEFLVLDKQNRAYEQYLRISCKMAGFEPKLRYLSKYSDLVNITASEMGIACLPEDHYLATLPNLKFLHVPEVIGTDVQVIWKNNTSNNALDLFLAVLRGEL